MLIITRKKGEMFYLQFKKEIMQDDEFVEIHHLGLNDYGEQVIGINADKKKVKVLRSELKK